MKWFFVLVCIFLSGCVQTKVEQQAKLSQYKATIPRCNTEEACEIMWAASRRWVLSSAAMKIQTHTDDFIETYNPIGGSAELAARVSKEPEGRGAYRFVVEAWCGNMFGCVPNNIDAMLSFNRMVSNAGHKANVAIKAPGSTKKDDQKTNGKYLYNAQELAKSHGCEAADLLSQNPPTEMYQTLCSGNSHIIKCEWNNCVVLK